MSAITRSFKCKGTLDGSEPMHRTFDVASGSAQSIDAGELVMIANGYAAVVADGGCATAGALYGLATSNSTDTVAAAGKVDVQYSPAGLIVEGAVTTGSNLATAILFDKVTLDSSAGVQTIDENDTTNGVLLIWDYDADADTAQVVVPFGNV